MDLLGDARSGEGVAGVGPSFEAVWPEVERRLRALLFRRGLDLTSAEDIVQEVALRALATGVTYASAQDLLRWAGPVACNLHIDLVRHRARLFDGEITHDHPATNDVAGEVADRLELQRALRGLAALRPSDRAAIIEAVTEDSAVQRPRKEAVRLAVRRHRARSRLLLVLEQLAAAIFGWRLLKPGRRAVAALAFVPVTAMAVLPFVADWDRPGHSVTSSPPATVSTAPEAMNRTIRTDRTAYGTVLRSAPVRRGVGSSAHLSGSGQQPPHKEVVPPRIHTPAGDAGHRDREQQDKTLCVFYLPVVGTQCLGQ